MKVSNAAFPKYLSKYLSHENIHKSKKSSEIKLKKFKREELGIYLKTNTERILEIKLGEF